MKRSGAAQKPDPAVPDAESQLLAGPSPDDIARRAYELYEARGCAAGCDMNDWLQAEAELRAAAEKAD